MNKNIEHYVFQKENFLDEKYCEKCVNELSMCDWEKHDWYNSLSDLRNTPSGDNEPEVFSHYTRTAPHKQLQSTYFEKNEFIIQELYSLIQEYIDKFKFDWFGGWTGYSEIKFIRYYPDQTMQNHCDHINSMFDGERKGIPVLSIIGILNDDFEGGKLIMFEDRQIDTKKGDLLIFPSNFLYPHEITPVTKGVRYSYVSWVW